MPDIFDNLTSESGLGPALQAALTNFDTSTSPRATSTFAAGPASPTSSTPRPRRKADDGRGRVCWSGWSCRPIRR